MRRLLALFSVLFPCSLLGASTLLRPTDDFAPRALTIHAERITPRGLQLARSLRFVGAYRLTGSDPNFGGISALARQGRQFVALSDAGVLIRFGLGDKDRRSATLASLPTGCGLGAARTTRDSESLIVDGETMWIGLEVRNRICRISPRGVSVVRPLAMRRWPRTGGAETMARLADGRTILIAERPRGGRRVSPALLFNSDPVDRSGAVVKFGYRPSPNYRPTDAATLPDGKLLVLERSHRRLFSFPGRLVIVSPETIASGAVVAGRGIARLGPPDLDQNFEAVAVSRSGNRSFVWLMSDDNFIPFQQTILLLLEYRGG